jgi:nucleotidyltransferase/DNA polymerase involved in DNA repair
VPAQPSLYVEYHHRLKEAIETCIPIAYVGSIDEVACELIGRERERANAVAIARSIKTAVRGIGDWLRCSVGIAPNHFLSKTATDMQKPDGLLVLEESDLPHALHRLELSDLCGIGPNTERRLQRRDESTGSLFADETKSRAVNGLLDRVNRRYGGNTLYFGSMQAAPMRIPFSTIPDPQLERDAEHNDLWLERMRQFKRLAETAHQRA